MAIPRATGAARLSDIDDGFGGLYTPRAPRQAGPLKQAIVGQGEPGGPLRDIPDLPLPLRAAYVEHTCLLFWSDLMSAVERLETGPAEAPSIEAELIEQPAKGRAKLRPLLALAPYVARYRGRAALAFVALTVAALTTLLVPVAVRRMIDFGLTPEGIALINSYFSVMIAVVAVLALASASRYYLVMTIGERIVADLQARRLRPSAVALAGLLRFRAQRRTGVAAHRRHHPDQIRGRRLRLDRAAQSDDVLWRGGDDGDHQPAPLRLRAAGDSPDRAAAGRLRALGAAAVAQCAGHARRGLRLCGRADRRDPHRAGLYQRRAGREAFRRRGRAGL